MELHANGFADPLNGGWTAAGSNGVAACLVLRLFSLDQHHGTLAVCCPALSGAGLGWYMGWGGVGAETAISAENSWRAFRFGSRLGLM